MKYLEMLYDFYSSWKNYHKMIDELRSMNDCELRDIGISRSDIMRIAADKTI